MTLNEQNELRRLREENARLKCLLTRHGIAWEEPTAPVSNSAPTEFAPAQTHFTTDDKVALFRRLFRGREDTPSAGNRPKARPAIHQPAAMSGSQASAANPA
jgi:hypothetical protein